MFTQSAIDTRLHPFQAIRAVRALLADPEDTRQVFVALRALRGRSALKVFHRFLKSETGAALMARRRSLLIALEDQAALARLPQGSLGRAYLAFMQDQNLAAAGLLEPSQIWGEEVLSPKVQFFRERMRDMHDLTHVLTGYGRDRLGELCLLAFMHAHTRNLGQALIVLMGMGRAYREGYGPAVRKAIAQAWRNGRKARWFVDLDWETLLARPLADLRAELKVRPPTRYAEVI